MKRRFWLHLILGWLWFVIAAVCIVLFFIDIPVEAIAVFFPSLVCAGFYFDKAHDIIKEDKRNDK